MLANWESFAGVRFALILAYPPFVRQGPSRWRYRMAEIRVEPRRRSLAWLWILLVLIIVGGLVYYFLYYK